MNSTQLIGRLTRDPELKKTNTGKSVLSFTIAVNRKFNKEQTDFINCVAWNQTADFIANYLNKGALISVEGSIQSRSYEDSSGKKVFVQEVNAERVEGLEPKGNKPVEVYEDEPTLDITSDDLPF